METIGRKRASGGNQYKCAAQWIAVFHVNNYFYYRIIIVIVQRHLAPINPMNAALISDEYSPKKTASVASEPEKQFTFEWRISLISIKM